MSNLKNASLVLRTADLPLDGSNSVGSMNATRTFMTWNNINLRLLLGDMYDSCDLFNLNITQIVSTIGPTFGTTVDDRNVTLRISSLPFINQTYSVKNGCNTNIAHLCSFVKIGGNSIYAVSFINNSLTFGKNQDMCNITISYAKVTGDDTNTPHVALDMLLMFNIYGVTKEPSYNTDKRIF